MMKGCIQRNPGYGRKDFMHAVVLASWTARLAGLRLIYCSTGATYLVKHSYNVLHLQGKLGDTNKLQ